MAMMMQLLMMKMCIYAAAARCGDEILVLAMSRRISPIYILMGSIVRLSG